MNQPRTRKTVIKASVSSTVATLTDVGALAVFVQVFAVHVTWSAFWAACIGGITNYLINKYWVFVDGKPIHLEQVARYAFVSFGCALLVAGIVHVLAVWMSVHYLIAKAVAAIVAFFAWTYPAQSWFVFPQKKPAPADSA